MNFREFEISTDKLVQLTTESQTELTEYMSLYNQRRFYVGDTGVNRKTLNSWKKSGLLPYVQSSNGWQKMSFIECCWLLCIKELGALGVSLNKVLEVKAELFDEDYKALKELMIYGLNNYPAEISNKQMLLAIYQNPEITEELFKQVFNELQISKFLLILMATITENKNIFLVYNKSNQMKLVVFDFIADKKYNKENEESLRDLFGNSFVGLNFKKIIMDFFGKEDLVHNPDFVIDFLSSGEKKIIREIRESDAKEIMIQFNDNKLPTHIRVKKKGVTEEAINKVARYLKKGKYQKVEFITKDGKLISYNETDIRKMK